MGGGGGGGRGRENLLAGIGFKQNESSEWF